MDFAGISLSTWLLFGASIIAALVVGHLTGKDKGVENWLAAHGHPGAAAAVSNYLTKLVNELQSVAAKFAGVAQPAPPVLLSSSTSEPLSADYFDSDDLLIAYGASQTAQPLMIDNRLRKSGNGAPLLYYTVGAGPAVSNRPQAAATTLPRVAAPA